MCAVGPTYYVPRNSRMKSAPMLGVDGEKGTRRTAHTTSNSIIVLLQQNSTIRTHDNLVLRVSKLAPSDIQESRGTLKASTPPSSHVTSSVLCQSFVFLPPSILRPSPTLITRSHILLSTFLHAWYRIKTKASFPRIITGLRSARLGSCSQRA